LGVPGKQQLAKLPESALSVGASRGFMRFFRARVRILQGQVAVHEPDGEGGEHLGDHSFGGLTMGAVKICELDDRHRRVHRTFGWSVGRLQNRSGRAWSLEKN